MCSLPGAAALPFTAATSAPDRAAARVELGKRLFFDPLLSKDRTVSCASCHKPEQAFADDSRGEPGRRRATGHAQHAERHERLGPDHAVLGWPRRDAGRSGDLSDPESGRDGAAHRRGARAHQRRSDSIREQFQLAYDGPATARTARARAAAYQKTLDTLNSPYDRYAHGDDAAISESAKRGRLLFIGRGKCAECHSGEDFTSDRFRNIGLFDGGKLNDRGRGAVTGKRSRRTGSSRCRRCATSP